MDCDIPTKPLVCIKEERRISQDIASNHEVRCLDLIRSQETIQQGGSLR